ncbi:hypothetical protein Tco_0442581 [Tanacetum coccineum]
MYYPRFTKVVVDYFMTKDLSIPRRNKMFWHTARNDPMFTTIRVIFKHQDTQIYGAILPQHLTNQAMLKSEAYKTYHAYATGEKIPKTKYVKNKADPESSPKKKSAQASKGKRIKTSTKVAKPVKKKQPATTSKEKGLNVLSEVALSEAEQIKLATKRSLIQTHSSHASGSGADEGTGVIPGVPDVPTYNSDDEQISWKSSDEDDDDEVNVSEDDDNQNDDDADNEDDDEVNVSEDDDDQNDDNADNEGDDDQDDDNEQTESDNDDDDLVHPKLSTFDEKERQDEEDKEEEWSDDEAYDDETQGVNVEGEELDEEQTNEEEEANELYRDVNVNLEGRDTEMTDAPQTNIQSTQVTEDTHVIITAATPEGQQQSSSVSSGFISNMLNPNPDTGIDSILNLNTESTSLVDVPVSTNVEMPPSSVTPLPPPPIPFIQPQQQTPVPTPTIVPSVSSIPSIVDTYLANKMNEAVKTVVQLQSDRLRDEAQAENEHFINTLDENMRKIIKKQVKEQTSHAVAANLSEHELKNILIDKMENNKLIDRSIQQKTLYNALVNAYETDKDILETYGDTVTFKRRRDDEDENEEPSARSNRGSKRRRAGKEPESTKEPIHADEDLEEPAHQEFDTGFTEDQPIDATTQHPDWFQKPTKPPTPDRDWNKTFPAKHGPVQPWISTLAHNEDPRESFNELMDTPLDFSAFVMNRLKVDTLTPELLNTPTYELMKVNMESARDVYSKHRILAVTNLKIVEWHNYKHLDWITVCRNEDKLYTFKEGDYNRLRLQDIKDMLLLLVQDKLINLNVEERVESYQKKLNLTRPDTYKSDLKRKTPYTAYSNPKGFIYHNKDKKNILMRIDELHKFSDGTLNDVRSALDDILKQIRMEYLPQTIWRNVDRERAGAMIQAIDRQLRNRSHGPIDAMHNLPSPLRSLKTLVSFLMENTTVFSIRTFFLNVELVDIDNVCLILLTSEEMEICLRPDIQQAHGGDVGDLTI